MSPKGRLWYPAAIALSALNVAAVWFAARPGEPMHATIHAALAVGFGLWAAHLRRVRQDEAFAAAHDPLALEVDQLRQELGEAQERLDFAERLLAQERAPSPR